MKANCDKVRVRITDTENQVFQYGFYSSERVVQCVNAELQRIIEGKITSIFILKDKDEKIEQEREQQMQILDTSGIYQTQLLREQLLLFDKDLDIANYIQTQKTLAENCEQQLTDLSFVLIKLCRELLLNKKPLLDLNFQEENYSRQKLDKIESQCMAALMRVREERKRIQSCCICLNSRSNMLILPCMHLVLCRGCARPTLRKCPICMQPITQTREVFQ